MNPCKRALWSALATCTRAARTARSLGSRRTGEERELRVAKALRKAADGDEL